MIIKSLSYNDGGADMRGLAPPFSGFSLDLDFVFKIEMK